MLVKFITAEEEYKRNKELKKEDVESLKQWMSKQNHLPTISETSLITFLHSCYYRIEQAKITIENNFTVRTKWTEIFKNQNLQQISQILKTMTCIPMPRRTPEGYKIFFSNITDANPEKFDYVSMLKMVDMIITLTLAQEGTSEGFVFVSDASGGSLGHAKKLNVSTMKKHAFFLQEAAPVRLKAVHMINVNPLVERVMNILRSFLKKEVAEMFHFHSKIDTLYQYVPLEYLPDEYGGKGGSLDELTKSLIQNLKDNEEFFKENEKLGTDEERRIGTPNVVDEVFGIGVEGNFRKLNID